MKTYTIEEKIELALGFINASKNSLDVDEALSAVLKLAGNNEPASICIIGQFQKLSERMLMNIIGHDGMEWIQWYCWEADFGAKKNFEYSTNHVKSYVSEESVENFLRKVLV